MKRALGNLVKGAVKNVKRKINELRVQNSDVDVEMAVENTEVHRLAMVEREKTQLDKQGPCTELVQVDHPSTSSGKGTILASNVASFSCEEFETLAMKIKHLFAQKSDVETAMEHAEIQPGKKRRKEVELWLARVEEMNIELEKIGGELEEQGPCKKLKNQIASKTREVEQLIQQGKFTTGVALDHHPVLEMVETSLVGSRSTENIEMILNWLKEDSVSAIGVHGMGGVGKTTLLKTIHNKLVQDSGINGLVYWVTASRDCSLQKLQTAIGKCLHLGNIAEEDDERRKSLIFHRLCQLQRSVLIIDDIWAHYPKDKIGIPVDSCKIVLTTRSLQVCQKVGCQKVIKVSPLLIEDAWALFVEKSGVLYNNFIPIARGIVKECAGLPLALITMGSCMRGVTDVHQWENTLYELKKPARRQDHDMDDEVFRILQFSYDSLKEERMKQCVLSCVLFPEDGSILRDELIELWITEGLLDDIEGWENKVNKGHTILNRLESSSLLESTNINYRGERCVIMHDLVRDMIMILSQHGNLYMAKAGLQLVKIPDDKELTIDLVKVSLSYNNIEEIPCGMSPDTPKLKVLILSHNPLKEIPESFFVHMKALEVLDLSCTSIERVPDTVSDLENLRGLFLQNCHNLRYVPCVAKLTRLMALDLSIFDCLKRGVVKGLGRLNCLEKLCIHSPWSTLDVPGFNKLMLYGQLKVYRIVLGSLPPESFYDDTEEIDHYKKTVRIYGECESEINPVLPSTIQSLVIKDNSIHGQRSLEEAFPSLKHATDLRELAIEGCGRLEYVFISSSASLDGSSNYPLQSFRLEKFANATRIGVPGMYIKSLHISECPNIRYVFACTTLLQQEQMVILPFLESITIQSCDRLEEIIEFNKGSPSSSQTTGHTTNATFPNLRCLRLRYLPKLGSVYSMRLHLCTSLEDIEIEDCPKIEEIFGDMNPENVNRSVALPRLRSLFLRDLSKLGSILPLQLHLCTCLEEIDIKFCPNLESISEQVQEIYEPNRKSSETVDHRVVVPLPNLRLVQLTRLPNLSCSIYSLQLHLCTSLEILSIKECPKIEGVFTNPGHDTELILDLP